MTDIILTCAAFIVLTAVMFFIIFYIRNKKHKKINPFYLTLICILAVIIAASASILIYFSIYYHAEESASESLNSTDNCIVTNIDEGYFFDGPGTYSALVFYPGAKVESEAYAPLMKMISEKGIDCFLIKMPLNFALLGTDKASSVIEKYDYEKWIISGHSLGGAVASMYASENTNKINGLVLLASYSTEKINDNIKVLSLYGSEDLVLNKDKYTASIMNLPHDFKEYIITGGNHADFGDYGTQYGDGNAVISSDEQKKITASQIVLEYSDLQ